MAYLKFIFAFGICTNLLAATPKPIQRPTLMRSCKLECPEAKNEKQMMVCAEKLSLSAGAKKFERSKCFKEYKRLKEKKE